MVPAPHRLPRHDPIPFVRSRDNRFALRLWLPLGSSWLGFESTTPISKTGSSARPNLLRILPNPA